MNTFDVAYFFYGCVFAIAALFMLMVLSGILLQHLLSDVIAQCHEAMVWCDKVKDSANSANDTLLKAANVVADDAAQKNLIDARNLLADSKAILAEGNEICKMVPRFQAYLQRAEARGVS